MAHTAIFAQDVACRPFVARFSVRKSTIGSVTLESTVASTYFSVDLGICLKTALPQLPVLTVQPNTRNLVSLLNDGGHTAVKAVISSSTICNLGPNRSELAASKFPENKGHKWLACSI